MGSMNCLYICLYAQFEILQTTLCLRVVHALNPSPRSGPTYKLYVVQIITKNKMYIRFM
jgi:hypothetical protein